ncbi:hypothetical protein [Dehalococcoides mccartyi]|uniref:hypothetical protein n=1 Tax=Dehalococcoides mccartyi TaxID=61435 RepID=UPI00054E2340|nr:hypothetical protein [Dehalococcoides mccartyi]MDN4185477.1 hypothetical protein [Dehalococcoides mccartyi]
MKVALYARVNKMQLKGLQDFCQRENLDAEIVIGDTSGKSKRIGRPQKDVNLAKVCAAFRISENNYTKAAEIVTRETGVHVSHGFIQKRLIRAAEAQGLTISQLVDMELEQEEVTA